MCQGVRLEVFQILPYPADPFILLKQVLEEAGYGDYIMHRTFHGIGLGGHEYPYYTAFMDRKIMPGMVLSCEPGIYVPGFGGFRHSDTVIVTEEGPELCTKFPRDLESLTVKA